MKKLLTVTLIALGLSMGAARAVDFPVGATDINTATLNSFQADFKEATQVKWIVSRYCQQANFVINGKAMTAYYNFEGTFLGLTHDVNAGSIPAKAMQQINKNFKGYTVNKFIVLQTGDTVNSDIDEVAYFADLTKGDNSEVLVRITPQANVEFFRQIR